MPSRTFGALHRSAPIVRLAEQQAVRGPDPRALRALHRSAPTVQLAQHQAVRGPDPRDPLRRAARLDGPLGRIGPQSWRRGVRLIKAGIGATTALCPARAVIGKPAAPGRPAPAFPPGLADQAARPADRAANGPLHDHEPAPTHPAMPCATRRKAAPQAIPPTAQQGPQAPRPVGRAQTCRPVAAPAVGRARPTSRQGRGPRVIRRFSRQSPPSVPAFRRGAGSSGLRGPADRPSRRGAPPASSAPSPRFPRSSGGSRRRSAPPDG